MPEQQRFGWPQIVRLGLVQAMLGAVVVLTTSTLNRVMVVELALPALLPGVLVAFHYLVQIARPRMGHGSDVGGRRTPWIVGGMAVLGLGGICAALAVAWMAQSRSSGIALAFAAFALIGLGVSASGTSLLVLLAKRVAPERRAAAATTVWLMMIVGFAVTAGVAGPLLDPYSPARLVAVTAAVSCIAFVVACLAVRGVEGAAPPQTTAAAPSTTTATTPPATPFRVALAQTWADPQARQFTVFVFISMLAYSAQDLILEPFAGTVLGYTPGQSTSLSGVQHGGVFVGMLLAAAAGSRWGGRTMGSLRGWTVAGCVASALALLGLSAAGFTGQAAPFKATVFALGVSNGVFSIAAIGSMMRLAGAHDGSTAPGHDTPREGVRMGLWGAAQALAFGLGGLVGTGASDLARWLIAAPGTAYAVVFALEALLFIVSARMAARLDITHAPPNRTAPAPGANWETGGQHGTA